MRRCRNVCLLYDCFGGLLQAQLDYALCISVRRLAFLYNVEDSYSVRQHSEGGGEGEAVAGGRPESPLSVA